MEILAIAQQGLQNARAQFDKAAQGIALMATQPDAVPNGTQPSTDTVSLSDQMIAMMAAHTQFDASLDAAHVANDMQKRTLDLLA